MAKSKVKKLTQASMRDCYWLAHFYHVSPNEFLSLPAAEIRQHMKYSKELWATVETTGRHE